MELLPDFLRSVVSGAMFALLLFTLGQPKLEKKWMNTAFGIILLADVMTSLFFYKNLNLTELAKFDIVFYFAVGIITKPLFRDTIMQWCFNFITAMNAFAVVMILSYYAADFLPVPHYANSVLRLLLFLGITYLFRTFRPVYRRVVERWQVFAFVVLAVILNFGYYIVASEDILQTFDTQVRPLLLLIVLTIGVYFCVFYSLHKIASEYALREENLNMQNRQDIMRLSLSSMTQNLHLMDELAQQNNISAHDRRHFNNTILELLRQNQTTEVISILEQQAGTALPVIQTFCENATVNAAVTYYAGLAENRDIAIAATLDIPDKLNTDSLELAIVISNLLENAIHACEKLAEKKIFHFTTIYTGGQLLLEVKNHYSGTVETDENGYPISGEAGHGVGTKSVLAFAEKQNAQVLYTIKDGVFRVRIIL